MSDRAFRMLLSVVVLGVLAACGDEGPAAPPPAIRVTIVDAQGEPATWAEYLLRRGDRDVRSKWDRETATLFLPREDAPHGLRVTAVGHRIVVADDIRDDLQITLRRGLVVHVDVTNTADGPHPPRVVLLRVRPSVQGDPDTDAKASAKVTEIAGLMFPVAPQDGSLPILPTRHWGFGVTPTDARGGFYVPLPGRYVVHWGLHDTDERTWFTQEGEGLVFEVRDTTEPQRVTLSIDERGMQATDLGLQKRIDRIKAREEAASDHDE